MRKPGWYWCYDRQWKRWYPKEWLAAQDIPWGNGNIRHSPAGWYYEVEEEPWITDDVVGDFIPTPEGIL